MIEVEREGFHHKHKTGADPDAHLRWRWHVRGRPEINGTSKEPLLDACRKLIAAGADPRSEVRIFRPGSSVWDMRTTAGYGAGLTVKETRTEGPLFVKYRKFEKFE